MVQKQNKWNPAYFRKMLDKYDQNNNDSDYFSAITASGEDKARKIFKFLNQWHCRVKARPIKLQKFLILNQKRINKWKTEKLEQVKLEPRNAEIAVLFDNLSETTKYTGAAKTLHLLAPTYFPMWDGAIRHHFGCSENGQGYYNFMIRQQELLKQLLSWIAEGKINLPEDKTALKLLDEYHWAMKYKN